MYVGGLEERRHLSLGQMSSLSLESVLVSDVVDGVRDTIVSDEAVRSTGNDSRLLGSESLQLSLLALGHTIAGLESERAAN